MRKTASAYPERSRRGFTLVELLVVISIIAILAVIGLVVFSGVQKNARNAKRIADLKAIALALEAYYNDPVNKFTYPYDKITAGWRSECIGSVGWVGGLPANDVIPGLVPNYLAEFPSDPGMTQPATSCYLYNSLDGKDYALLDYQIGEFANSKNDYLSYGQFIDPRRDGGTDNCTVDFNPIGPGPFAWKIYSFNNGTGGQCL